MPLAIRPALALVLAAALSPFVAPAAATAASAASGSYAFAGGPTLEIQDAVAYHREEYGERQLVVVLFPAPVDHSSLGGTLDVESAVEALTEEGSYLELSFDEAGTWTGTSYALRYEGGSSSGSSYDPQAEDGMRATVASGRVSGRLQAAPSGDAVDITLAVPIAEPPAGEALPEGGGEPGAALRACNAAYGSKDRKSLDRVCSVHLSEVVDSAVRYEFEDLWTRQGAGTCEVAAVSDLEVRGGIVAGDEARLDVRGGWGEGTTCGGQVFLRRGAGGWRVSASRLDYVYDESE